MNEIIFSPNAPAPIGPYSHAVKTTGMFLFTSGQIALNTQGVMVGTDVAAQTEQAIANLNAILESAKTSLRNVFKTTVFLRDMNDFVAMNTVYEKYFNEAKPARSTVQAARLPKDALVEIEAVATIP
jgi:2-iminobutanoate/2-iminopropanoate deaminase